MHDVRDAVALGYRFRQRRRLPGHLAVLACVFRAGLGLGRAAAKLGLDVIWHGGGRVEGGVLGEGDQLGFGQVRVAGQEEGVVGEEGDGFGAGYVRGEAGGVGYCRGGGEDFPWEGGVSDMGVRWDGRFVRDLHDILGLVFDV